MVKNPPVNAGDMGLTPGLGRSPGVGNGNPLQYSCPRNSVDRGAWWATVHGVAKNQTRLSTHRQTSEKHLAQTQVGGNQPKDKLVDLGCTIRLFVTKPLQYTTSHIINVNSGSCSRLIRIRSGPQQKTLILHLAVKLCREKPP